MEYFEYESMNPSRQNGILHIFLFWIYLHRPLLNQRHIRIGEMLILMLKALGSIPTGRACAMRE